MPVVSVGSMPSKMPVMSVVSNPAMTCPAHVGCMAAHPSYMSRPAEMGRMPAHPSCTSHSCSPSCSAMMGRPAGVRTARVTPSVAAAPMTTCGMASSTAAPAATAARLHCGDGCHDQAQQCNSY